jgi:hypothetical protein
VTNAILDLFLLLIRADEPDDDGWDFGTVRQPADFRSPLPSQSLGMRQATSTTTLTPMSNSSSAQSIQYAQPPQQRMQTGGRLQQAGMRQSTSSINQITVSVYIECTCDGT